ncbi:hypothetical protein H8N03_18920 [Ramlibacter sp. USB13]|uniref:Uncharacterized protein n=1 Tax=Ramlibacter cellulosilyticus TaxID=2764187 RepID=A0A923MU43_9BURK|nr:hypothetical protein [Ramlibacter cellulosilyticus]MBC5785026.1 hypothetical protein [Ramlibacter cellulosilyticus]
MSETKTASMLQRVPVILAVTAQSYGLELRAGGSRRPHAAGERHRHAGHKDGDKPSAQR